MIVLIGLSIDSRGQVMTIHKSQSLSLDRVKIMLEKSWDCAQVWWCAVQCACSAVRCGVLTELF